MCNFFKSGHLVVCRWWLCFNLLGPISLVGIGKWTQPVCNAITSCILICLSCLWYLPWHLWGLSTFYATLIGCWTREWWIIHLAYCLFCQRNLETHYLDLLCHGQFHDPVIEEQCWNGLEKVMICVIVFSGCKVCFMASRYLHWVSVTLVWVLATWDVITLFLVYTAKNIFAWAYQSFNVQLWRWMSHLLVGCHLCRTLIWCGMLTEGHKVWVVHWWWGCWETSYCMPSGVVHSFLHHHWLYLYESLMALPWKFDMEI